MQRGANNVPISVRRGSPGTRSVAAVRQIEGLRTGLVIGHTWVRPVVRPGDLAATCQNHIGEPFPARSSTARQRKSRHRPDC
jgi:hypothetical protein